MNTASYYARALYALLEEQPKQSEVFVRNLFATLKRRGHVRLASRIFGEYQKLLLQKDRAVMHAHTTPQQEESRVLLQLYRRLVATE